MGGGPAGSFFSYFLLQIAQRMQLELNVDIYEARDFSLTGPKGCNMCGGIISESLVQNLAAEGINLPPSVVQRGLDSYFLHMDVGSVRIETPLQEMRIAAVHRGCGPRGMKEELKVRGFDGYMLDLALAKGANLARKRVDGVGLEEGRPWVKTQDGSRATYDLLAVAVGVNTSAMKLFDGLGLKYKPPRSTKTHIREFWLGRETIKKYLGSSMHVFLLNIPRLEFAALIPKGDYVTLCLLGHDIDKQLIESFIDAPEVRLCLPPDWKPPQDFCHCAPRISIKGAVEPFADRMVFVGDCGVTRLYKDGIGAAYRTAKAAAITTVFEGVSAEDFRRHFQPVCRAVASDNLIGELVFAAARQIQKRRFARRGVLRMVSKEQKEEGDRRRMSSVLWDTFTGSAPYQQVFLRTLHPAFLGRLVWDIAAGNMPFGKTQGPGRPQ
jgi:flavin-dependent dehydrogenase